MRIGGFWQNLWWLNLITTVFIKKKLCGGFSGVNLPSNVSGDTITDPFTIHNRDLAHRDLVFFEVICEFFPMLGDEFFSQRFDVARLDSHSIS
jgi:hypothetical protein